MSACLSLCTSIETVSLKLWSPWPVHTLTPVDAMADRVMSNTLLSAAFYCEPGGEVDIARCCKGLVVAICTVQRELLSSKDVLSSELFAYGLAQRASDRLRWSLCSCMTLNIEITTTLPSRVNQDRVFATHHSTPCPLCNRERMKYWLRKPSSQSSSVNESCDRRSLPTLDRALMLQTYGAHRLIRHLGS